MEGPSLRGFEGQNLSQEMKKTNAVRILDQHKIEYKLFEYEVNENDLSAENVAKIMGHSIDLVFKTLVLSGDKTGVIVAVIPGAGEVDLKALAALSGNKKCAMVHLKDVQAITGYIRGGVSPVGMKKNFPTFVDELAINHPQIFVSAGMRGLQCQIRPLDLTRITHAKTGTISILT
jgi:Cys-tRNA(Pro)/Cys-tRNA(Cys) deacylase